MSVLLGTGSFAKATNITTGDQVTSVAVADLNGDNHPDLAVTGFLSNSVSVLLNAQPPVAAGDVYHTAEDTALSVAAPGVLGNDTDADADPLRAFPASPPGHGNLTLDLDGSYVYIPVTGYRGPDSFTYTARDATAASRVATVAITVTPTGGPPPAAVTDLPAVLRAGDGFLLRDSLTTGDPTTSFSYGAQPQTVIMGDWNGDGVATPGTFSGGVFKLRNSNTAGPPEVTFTFGDPRGYPVAGDFNGDGTNTVGVYRNGVWQLTNVNATSTPMVVNFGTGSWPATVPLVGDCNGDGTDTLGTWTAGTFSLRNTNTTGPAEVSVAYGPANAYPLVGDWNGDGTDTVGVRTTTAAWQLNNANDTSPADLTFTYGLPNDLPLVWRNKP